MSLAAVFSMRGVPRKLSSNRVLKNAGQATETRTPCEANSARSDSLKATTAALATP